MRFAIDESDPGHVNYRAFQPIRVHLDGKPMPHVQCVDTDTGEVVVALLDLDGFPYLNESKTAIATATLRGRVNVELLPQPH